MTAPLPLPYKALRALCPYPYCITKEIDSCCNRVLFSEPDTLFTRRYLIVLKVGAFILFSSQGPSFTNSYISRFFNITFSSSWLPQATMGEDSTQKDLFTWKNGLEVLPKKSEVPVVELFRPVDWPSLPVSQNTEKSSLLACLILPGQRTPVNNSSVNLVTKKKKHETTWEGQSGQVYPIV